MQTVLKELLEGNVRNTIIPFFWQHGEDESVLRQLIGKIDEAHIKALCVESRPHPDFLGETWWRDMDIIMEECKRRSMNVWLLDDAAFPTGYAAGRIKKDYPQYRKLFLKESHIDVLGPGEGASLLLKVPGGDTLCRVVACRRTGEADAVDGQFFDLTGNIGDDQVYWDIPDGLWRVYYLTLSHVSGHSERLDEYLNPLTPEGTQVLIDTVYEAHFARYGEEFGRTFQGFFSDEPQLGNAYGYHAAIGRVPFMPMPWCDGLEKLMEEALGSDAMALLPGLWYDIGSRTWEVRYAYMNAMTFLYGKHFCAKIGNWCRAHGVMYIGHVIEENNCHTHLGNGTGHYFRALWGQDMAGIDVVLHEIIPGIKGPSHAWASRDFEADDEFFYYGLAKLASSLAHADPKKKGRAMCEIFGAYGWMEGLKQMKWLADFMLVRGINWFVPHAFTPKGFPDPDCPPHFYAMGHNPQFRHFHLLMDYMNRMSSLIRDGVHMAQAAVVYHAEGEWSGDPFMKFQEPVHALADYQIDCDVLPVDVFADGMGNVEDCCYVLGNERYRAVVIPYTQAIPKAFASWAAKASEAGVLVVFVNGFPCRYCEGGNPAALEKQLKGCIQLPLEELGEYMVRNGCYDILTDGVYPDLRTYHYRQGSADHYLFFNESVTQAVSAELTFQDVRPPLLYDAFRNIALNIDSWRDPDRRLTMVQLRLEPYTAAVLTFDRENKEIERRDMYLSDGVGFGSDDVASYPIEDPWQVSIAKGEEYPAFTPYQTMETLSNLNRPGGLPRFSGTIRYECNFEVPSGLAIIRGDLALNLGCVGETAQVWLNDMDLGVAITHPYLFNITGLLRKGANSLIIEVTNTLGYEMHDALSVYQPLPPSGLVGPVTIQYCPF